MPSQFDGLADRGRVFPREADATYIPKLEVGELHFGGIVLSAIGGTQYANGRLLIAGKGDNSCEVELHPGPDITGRGVRTQILMFAKRTVGYLRHCWSFNNDGTNDLFNEDQGISGARVQAPWYRKTGEWTSEADGSISPRDGKPYAAGEDDGGRYIDAYFPDGSDEFYLKDGRRVSYRSVIAAMVHYAEANGIPLEIR